MDIGLLAKLFGKNQEWHGSCTVILDAEATVQAVGGDAIGTGGAKAYAPRTISGRISAEAVCMLKDSSAVVLLQQTRSKTATGEEQVKHTLTLADPQHIVAVEFVEKVFEALQAMGLSMPAVKSGSHPGTLTRPKPVAPA